jgi:hypothetical protein
VERTELTASRVAARLRAALDTVTPNAWQVAVAIDVLIVFLFGSVVIGLLYAGFRINQEERSLASKEIATVAPESAPEVPSQPTLAAEPAHAAVWAVYQIERRLRHELALAQAFSEDPSAQTLWPH